VDYTVSPGTAAAGSDFVAGRGTLTFSAGQVSRPLTVTVNGDTAIEGDESFGIFLDNPGNATVLDPFATGIIVNDDVSAGGTFGLDERPANPGCIAPERPTDGTFLVTVDAFPAAPAFTQPTKILQAPGDASRWFVLEKGGLLKVFSTANPASVSTWLDLTGPVNPAGEGGLLGMAFHPNWPATREVFISYTTDGSPLTSRISRFIVDNATQPGSYTEQVVLTVNQPYDNHNGGDIAFGPDGALYIGLGDGGSANDPDNLAQNHTRLLGKMLRINVVGVAFPSPGYTIPGDNPFAGNAKCGAGSNAAACPEIFASGLRNPWRWSFDRPTGDLWLGDVGQSSREEINRIQRGGNYGWDCREGLLDFSGGSGCSIPSPMTGPIDPVIDYPHGNGDASVTGGFVYRGAALPGLQGRYVFGDFSSGRIRALTSNGLGGYASEELLNTPYNISAFGLGEDGELYLADYGGGRIYRLGSGNAGGGDTIPSSLADTGCVSASDPTQPAPGLVPYAVNAPFWSDGAFKERWLALPDGFRINIEASGDFDFPSGSVLMKTFRLGGKLVETRLLMRHPDGVWAGYTYEWNDAQTAATRVIGGKTRFVNGQNWIYPSEGDCLRCHTAAAGFALGPEIAQLNRSFTYPTTGRNANQLATLEHIDMFSAPLPAPPESLPALANPADASASLDNRARAWLETNCAQCHRPGGPTPSGIDLRALTPLASTGTCDVPPQAGDLGIPNARLLAPGDAGRSILVARSNRRDGNGMPPVGSNQVDSGGVALLSEWINSLGGCF
jgi:uncharacterized repeat protein (TIGR03806 family)